MLKEAKDSANTIASTNSPSHQASEVGPNNLTHPTGQF